MQIFHDSPSYGDAVVGGSASSKFVEEYERLWRYIIKDIGCLGHLNHKGRFTKGYVVACSNTGEYLIHQTYACAFGRNKRANLCHQYDEGSLAQKCRLTRHVRTRDNHNLLTVGVEHNIVGYILLAYWHLSLDDGMASLLDVDDVGVVDDGAHILMLLCSLGSREQTVETSDKIGIGLYLLDILLRIYDEVVEEFRLQCENLFLGTEYLLLVFLQFLGDISLSLGKSLLAYPLLGHLFLVGVSHFEIISEDIVITNLQTCDTGLFHLALLYFQ